MAKFLLLETATDSCSVGLWETGQLIIERNAAERFAHTRSTTLLIEEALAHAGWKIKDLDAVGISAGPGSYTALRVGAATAKGICFAGDIPLVAVSTLASLAWAMQAQLGKTTDSSTIYVPMIDARRMEVYGANYDASVQAMMPETAFIVDEAKLTELQNGAQQLYLGGNGAEKCRELLQDGQQIVDIQCAAKHLGPLVQRDFEAEKHADLAYFSPNYLKPPNITTPKPIWR